MTHRLQDPKGAAEPGGAGFRPSRRGLLQLGLLAGAAGLVRPGLVLGQAASAKPPAQPTGQVVVGISQEPTVFNPLMLHIEVDEGVYFNIFSPLWSVAPDGSLVPELAAEVPTVANGGLSEDGLNWRVKLRDNVKWHDGEPFTAEDVKYTLDLINNPDFRAGRRAGHELVRDIKVVSPTEITWRMETRLRALRRDPLLDLHGPQAHPLQGQLIRTPRPSTMRRSAPGPSSGSSACRATTSRSPPTPTSTARGRISSG